LQNQPPVTRAQDASPFHALEFLIDALTRSADELRKILLR
jgi:hypothetical protein